jgi:hypothetical protein
VQAGIYEIRNVKKNRNTKTKRKMEKGRKRGRKEGKEGERKKTKQGTEIVEENEEAEILH